MKPNLTSLILCAAALVSTLAYAGPEMMPAERGSHCSLAATTITITDMDKKADPMEMAVNEAVESTADPVLASYYRDLYRAPASFPTVKFDRTADPYVDALSLALHGSVEPDSRRVC